MGLISAALNAAGGTLASQWKEYFYVDSLPDNVLATKAQKKVRGRFGGSRHEDDNVISDGSVIAVADGQCMMIVDQGRIVDFCAEPGEYVFDQNGEPSLFYGAFNGDKVKALLKTTFDRLSFGGQAGKDQRVYFFNTKEILGNKYGTPSPVPFRVVDNNIGLDVDISIRCFGEYSYRMTNPMLFYTNVCGNIDGDYRDGESKLRGNGKTVPPLVAIKNPLRDGDTERPDDPAYANAFFISANSATAPGVVDAACNPILTRSEVYSGVYGRASISFYAFNSNGNRGIACGLNNLQKIRDGEPLGSRASAENDFADEDDEDFLS